MISVVTPSYNHFNFISDTINSVLSQNNIFEYIIVDSCSDDGSQEIIKSIDDYRVQSIIEHDNGQAEAIAKGFTVTKGDICAYLNSDDAYLPGVFEYVEEYFENHPDVDLVYGHRIFVNYHGEPTGLWILPPHSNYLMSRWDFIPQETCFWRRRLMDKVGGIDKSYQFALDYDLFVRMMKNGKLKRINKYFAVFRKHPNSKTESMLNTIGENEIRKVRSSHQIHFYWWDSIISRLFAYGIYSISFIIWNMTKSKLKTSIYNHLAKKHAFHN